MAQEEIMSVIAQRQHELRVTIQAADQSAYVLPSKSKEALSLVDAYFVGFIAGTLPMNGHA